jgi:hypothetical protein
VFKIKRKTLKVIIFALLTIVAGYYILGYASSFVGWYGYQKWKYRVHTKSIADAKRRKVFVQALHYKVDSFSGSLGDFAPYIEKGFKYGYHSSEDTRALTNTQFPYQLSFNYRPTKDITVTIRHEDLKKFDSANSSWGFLRKPALNDTIILQIRGKDIRTGTIKVW